MLRFALLLGTVFSGTTVADDGSGNWPAFRGDQPSGVRAQVKLPGEWSTTKNIAWVADIPGKGWSSPVVYGGRVFITTVAREEPEGDGQDAKKDEPKKG